MLFLSTTGSNLSVPELGITITHPTTNWDISAQFSAEEVALAHTLTSAIRAGTIVWRKTSGGAAQPATDYDPDYLEIVELSSGAGAIDSQLLMPFGSPILSLNPTISATSGGTLTLTRLSNTKQLFTGTLGHTIRLPNATTLAVGHTFDIWNFSSQPVSIQNAGGIFVGSVRSQTGRSTVILRTNTTSNGSWGFEAGTAFGTELQFATSDAEASTSSQTVWTNKVTLVTTSVDPGDYLLQWQFIWRGGANRNMDVRIQNNGNLVTTWQPWVNNVAERPLIAGFRRLESISGVNTLTLDFRVGPANSSTVFMSEARIFIWRIL